jgi:signal peptidase I
LSKLTRDTESRGSAYRAGPPPERTGLRDNLEYVAVLILIVLVIRQLVVEAFRIQHGSMAPTLLGVHREERCPVCGYVFEVGYTKVGHSGQVECPNCREVVGGGAGRNEITLKRPPWLWNSGTDAEGRRVSGAAAANRVDRGPSRIFVNKFIYQLRAPRRWEVVVFVYPYRDVRCPDCAWFGEIGPNDKLICPECGSRNLVVENPKSYIKRVVGLPGEQIELRDGDVWANGKLVRKPPAAQKELWFHVFDSAFMPVPERRPIWDFGRHSDAWQENGPNKGLLVDARGAAEPVTAQYARQITDFYSYDGLSFQTNPASWGAPGMYTVGDCRIRALVRVLGGDATDSAVLLGVRDAGHDFSLSVGAGDGRVLVSDGALPVRESRVPALNSGKPVWVTLENYDDRIVARVGGRTLVSFDYDGKRDFLHGVRFGARNARVSFDRIVIERDIYYNEPSTAGEKAYNLHEGQYFVIGDNCPASSDSRRWPAPGVPAQNIIGRAFFVFWPVHHMDFL